MKKLLLLVSFLFMSFVGVSQTDIDRSMKPILLDAITIINAVEEKGFEIVKIEFDIITDVKKETYRILSDAWMYRVFVFGDYRIEDIDLEVYKQNPDETFTLIAKDSKVESFATVDFKPDQMSWYKIVVKSYRFKYGYDAGHYGLLILHE